MVSVLHDRMTVLHVDDCHKDDHVFYKMIEEEILSNESIMQEFVDYLKPYFL
jgi:hypothetical protein